MIRIAPLANVFHAARVWAARLGGEFAASARVCGYERDANRAADTDWELFCSAAGDAVGGLPGPLKRCLSGYFKAQWAAVAARQETDTARVPVAS